MTTSDASIFITRDALAEQILEFGVLSNPDFEPSVVRSAQGDQYARDLAEHLMSEFIVIEPEPEEADAKADASLCAVCGGESFHHTVACAWPSSVEVTLEKVDPEVMALITGQHRAFGKPASNGRARPTDSITIDGVTYPIPVNRDYTINNHMTRDEVYEALGIAPPPKDDDLDDLVDF